MECPYCGNQMVQGNIWNRREYGLLWLPEGEEPPVVLTEKSIVKKNGIYLKVNPFGGYDARKVEMYICQKCNVGITRFDQIKK